MKYVHTNIICKDIDKLSKFYTDVFECVQVGSQTTMSGDWLAKGTGIENAEAKSVNLQLPGYEKGGPVLEMFQYTETLDIEKSPKANSKGIGHLAFSVANVQEVVNQALQNGGNKLGELVSQEFKSGTLTYAYVTDSEGNIIEVQNWTPK